MPPFLSSRALAAVLEPFKNLPTRAVASRFANILVSRQQGGSTFVSVPSRYGALRSSPEPGVVVAIVLGAVFGFLVIIFVVYSCLGFAPGFGGGDATSSYGTGSVLTLRSRPTHRHSRSRSRARVVETVEVRTRERDSRASARGPIIVDAGPDRGGVYVERRTSRPPPPRVVNVVGSSSEDEVIVIEDPPRRRDSRRRSGDTRRSSYREVDIERRGSRRRSGDR